MLSSMVFYIGEREKEEESETERQRETLHLGWS